MDISLPKQAPPFALQSCVAELLRASTPEQHTAACLHLLSRNADRTTHANGVIEATPRHASSNPA